MNDGSDLFEEPYEYQKLLGYSVTAWAEGEATIEMPLETKHGNRYGLPHGGVHASLLDTAMGFAGSYTGDPDAPQLVMTLSMTVQYLSRPKGKLLIAKGWRTGGGRKTYFADAELSDETGELIAKATGTFRYRSR
ncbi:PaaI family thioesterase [Neptunicoccus cionae]|uniref:PaaI family thioesterase n=1 Tax=Neptunicoccus cionae TaxID=2035344 RepID=UPI000C77D71D|nr:PaaI family thioesterase [Amylibacter cionae]PLS20396.1 PaaI family thioesterase [Amylibacter cionae]